MSLRVITCFLFSFICSLAPLRAAEPPQQTQHQVLFIMTELAIGGAERALVSMINAWDVPNTHIDVFLTKRGGTFESFLREDCSIVSEQEAFSRTYDVAAAYGEWLAPEDFLLRAKAKRRVQWIHTDLLASPFDVPLKHRECCEGIDVFACVSEKSAESLKTMFPDLSEKIHVISNVLDSSMIRKQALEKAKGFPKKSLITVVTVGRLTYPKALDRAIKVHNRLNKEHIRFRWLVVGEGEERPHLTALIKKYHLKKKFILLGAYSNPFPYVKKADIFALPSYYEGRSVAIEEAKSLRRPILMTNVSGAHEQIISGVNGLIVDNTEDAIYKGLKKLIKSKKLRKKFSKSLKNFTYDNSAIYKNIEELFFQ
jgi:glycosyltransferase involved in cell wall biosynthesis